jgi:crotonobetainyl-CoA:carnitine CoA-transferase CaiB-like acyl-CoA transferase
VSYEAPFAGLKVVDLSQGIAAPYAGMLLAQYGAEVIKVEVMGGGDWVRASAPEPGGNTSLSIMGNLGKRSIALDLKSSEGCAVLWRLIEGADVFMEGFRPGVIKRLGFSYEAVSAKNPGILYLAMSGFGQSGPLAERPAMDPVLQAFTGFMMENREADGTPKNVISIPVDLISALYVFQALSAALYARRDEQRGRYVEASLMHGAAWLNTYAMLQSFIHGGAPPPPRPPNNVFRTADGWLHVVVAGHRGWVEFCAAIDRPELATDSRFDSTGARQQNADLVVSICREILATRPTAHWIARFTEQRVMHAVVNSSMDFLREPHVEATGLFSYLAQPGLADPVPIPMLPGAPRPESGTQRGTAPLAGADTAAILAEHGYGEAEIAALTERRVVGRLASKSPAAARV